MSLSHTLARATVLAAVFASMAVAGQQPSPMVKGSATPEEPASQVHDFDFFAGNWRVHHRVLKARLADSHEWVEFDGTISSRPLMGGYANVDDTVLVKPEGTYTGVALRSFDPKTGQWSIWWLDGRTPLGPLDPPVRGGFKDGTGTFYGDDVFNGKPIRVRFIWSNITATSAQWEQAFSTDGGKTWETNWVQDVRKVP
jgi:hypothetical protein